MKFGNKAYRETYAEVEKVIKFSDDVIELCLRPVFGDLELYLSAAETRGRAIHAKKVLDKLSFIKRVTFKK